MPWPGALCHTLAIDTPGPIADVLLCFRSPLFYEPIWFESSKGLFLRKRSCSSSRSWFSLSYASNISWLNSVSFMTWCCSVSFLLRCFSSWISPINCYIFNAVSMMKFRKAGKSSMAFTPPAPILFPLSSKMRLTSSFLSPCQLTTVLKSGAKSKLMIKFICSRTITNSSF